jgi:hypothetical protein
VGKNVFLERAYSVHFRSSTGNASDVDGSVHSANWTTNSLAHLSSGASKIKIASGLPNIQYDSRIVNPSGIFGFLKSFIALVTLPGKTCRNVMNCILKTTLNLPYYKNIYGLTYYLKNIIRIIGKLGPASRVKSRM